MRRSIRVSMLSIGLSVLVTATAVAVTEAPAVAAPHRITTQRACPRPTAPQFAACQAIIRTDLPAGGVTPSVPAPPPGYGPSDLTAAYSLPSGGGSGRTVAIVDAYNDPTAAADLATYRARFGLPACTVASGCLRIVNQSGATSPLPANNTGWAGEESLDLDMVSAICPNCAIILVEASSNSVSNLYAAVDRAVAMGAKFVSNSWSLNEYSGETSADAHFNHPGVAITASTGDSGFGAQYPATSRYVTAVGGTRLTSSGGVWSETAWSGAGSGCSAYETKPTWQTVYTSCTRRAEADVSAVADPNTGVAVYQTYGASGWVVYGGTSVSAPIIASVYALAGNPVAGQYAAEYPYLHSAGGLNDVTSGSNGSCGAPICQAGIGWDGPTGLGSPWGTSSFAPPSPLFAFNPGNQSSMTDNPVSLTLSAIGSFTPYTWTSNALPAGLSLNASTGVISGTPATAGTTSVTVTVHSADASTASTTFTWTVTASLSLYISGPTSITAKGTYTYTAVTSGYTGPTFAWSERFCDDSAGSSCSAWQSTGVTGAVMTRTLNQDCGGTGTNTYWLDVTATNSDGRSQTSQLIVYLCELP